MSTAADMFAQSLVDMAQGMAANRQATRTLEDANRNAEAVEEQFNQLESANAGNLAEKHALRQQLARYAPNHPLLKNAQLIEKLREMGARALAINRNWDDVRAVGDNYFPPGTPPLNK
jgi:hypothetical protein